MVKMIIKGNEVFLTVAELKCLFNNAGRPKKNKVGRPKKSK